MEFIKRNPKIYIFSGKARAGKDTSAEIIKNHYEQNNKKVIILQYAFYLKEYAKKISGWDGSDENKPRQLLIDLGTGLIRKKISYNFFVDRMIQDIEIYSYYFDVIIISDARLVEELDYPKTKFKNVNLINIVRPNYDNGLTDEQKKSLTESALDSYDDYDYRLINDGTLEDLKYKIINMLGEML